jgi:hypothetical protein
MCGIAGQQHSSEPVGVGHKQVRRPWICDKDVMVKSGADTPLETSIHAATPVSGLPLNLSQPELWLNAPDMRSNVVVFPAPFVPINPRISPAWT